jgi:hypothetical protein
MFNTKVIEKIKPYIVFSNTIVENHVHYDVVWKYMVEPGVHR